MQVVHPVCCGIDVHQTRLTACLRCVEGDSQVTQEVREFATTYSALLGPEATSPPHTTKEQGAGDVLSFPSRPWVEVTV
jgi:hypothetical protein